MPVLEVTTTSGDGHIYAQNADYPTAHIAATGTVVAGANNMVIGQRYIAPLYRIWRTVLFFNWYYYLPAGIDKSSIVISAATVSIYGFLNNSDVDFNIVVVDGSDAHQPLQAADYGALRDDIAALSDLLNTVAFSISGYNVLTLIQAGIDLISTAATTLFALRSSNDIGLSSPIGLEWVSIHDAVSGKGAKLTVTYTARPMVTTQAVSEIAAATAQGNGNITFLGGTVSQHGHCWSLSANPTIADSKTENGAAGATGAFTSAITGLAGGTLYHVRAYATNERGTSYGADTTFTTLIAIPTVTTDPASAVSTTAATLNGTLDDDGGEACDCGFEWGETDAYGNTTPTESKTTGESFSQPITGLSSGTTYHFRAFATNSVGTGYSADTTFNTRFVCPYCAETFATEEERAAHIASDHPSNSISRAYALSREEL